MIPRFLPSLLLLAMPALPAVSENWETIQRSTQHALSELSIANGLNSSPPHHPSSSPISEQDAAPSVIVIGFTGGIEKENSKASGVAEIRRGLQEHFDGRENEVLVRTFNNLRWRRAASQTLELVRVARKQPRHVSASDPMIIVLGHSWGAGSIGKLARELQKEDVEIALAIYVDAFSFTNTFLFWRNPRVPENVRYAINFYQREGVLKGLPMRGKSKLIAKDPEATLLLGNYQVKPQTDFWGWRWNLLVPLLARHHHRLAHDPRLQNYLAEVVSSVLVPAAAQPAQLAESTLF